MPFRETCWSGEATVNAMVEAFIGSYALGLPERLVIALEAGQSAGGDKRGQAVGCDAGSQDRSLPLSQPPRR